MNILFYPLPLFVAAVLVSCGGGDSTPTPNPIQGVSPGGIWRGTDSASGLAITGLVDETGFGDFMRADNAVFDGQVSTSGNSISVDAQGYSSGGHNFPGGSTHGIWTMNGTIQERQSISATTVFKPDAGTSTQATLDLTFDALYNQPSSLATVAGAYNASSFTEFFDVGPDGSVSGHVVTLGNYSGQISVIDPTYNLYRVHLTFTADNGGGFDVDGLATMENSASATLLVVGVSTGTGGGWSGTFSFVDTWCNQSAPAGCS
jgi:hypothetical protein